MSNKLVGIHGGTELKWFVFSGNVFVQNTFNLRCDQWSADLNDASSLHTAVKTKASVAKGRPPSSLKKCAGLETPMSSEFLKKALPITRRRRSVW